MFELFCLVSLVGVYMYAKEPGAKEKDSEREIRQLNNSMQEWATKINDTIKYK